MLKHADPAFPCAFLTHQHLAAVHIEDFAGDEPCVLGAQEQNGRGNLFRRAHPAERDGGEHFFAGGGIVQCWRGQMPWLATRMSRAPKRSIACLTRACADSVLRRSASTAAQRSWPHSARTESAALRFF